MKINEIREPPYLRHENKQSITLGLFFCGENSGEFYSLIKRFDI